MSKLLGLEWRMTILTVSDDEIEFLCSCGLITPASQTEKADYYFDMRLDFGQQKIENLLLMRALILAIPAVPLHLVSCLQHRLDELRDDANNRLPWQVLQSHINGKSKSAIRAIIPKEQQ